MDLRGRWFGGGEGLAVAEPGRPDPSSRPAAEAVEGQVAHRLLGQLLVADTAITRVALQEALAAQARSHAPLGDLLVSLGFCSRGDIEAALARQRSGAALSESEQLVTSQVGMDQRLRKLGVKESHIRAALQFAAATGTSLTRVVLDLGLISAETMAQALADENSREYFPQERVDRIDPSELDTLAVTEFSGYVPAGRMEGRLVVAVAEPEKILEAQTRWQAYRVEVVIASPRTIETIFRRHFARTEEAFRQSVLQWEERQRVARGAEAQDGNEVEWIYGRLIRHACYVGANDIFLHKTLAGVGKVKLHVNGVGQLFAAVKEDLFDKMLNKLVSENSNADALARAPQEANVGIIGGLREAFADITDRYSFRLQLNQGRNHSEREAVVRILDRQAEQADFHALGFDEQVERQLLQYSRSSTGLVVVCGPTGSGKTTSLYAMMKKIDPIERSIRTIEKPIEYRHSMWHQMEVPADVAEGEGVRIMLNATLRMAPHVILMGEIREDLDVANRVISAAFTGHLVYTTLHVTEAALAITRLRHIGVTSENLAAALRGVLAQRLVQMLCPDCRVPDAREETQAERRRSAWLADIEWNPLRQVGCARCGWSGFRGRRIIYELLDIDRDVRDLVERGATAREIARAGVPPGRSIWACGLRLVARGVTSIDELRRVADPPS
ncbi:MAG: Flp pilus assembly complex ATPase component TadA [Rhodocyclaceae bacterium]|jgi:type IV pilus assembly protein PilB|nr:Flp pilus assembly complex ATPase component TadA [Rhodocyclaceae bacterium]MCA3075011.1 Flp pilus assembly complex ATPase component TadA [Rhodocyclaceae bacterium]MCA3088370.1 Flp pilus assembly complex ATPase component TadA [Rhodocyclaceae bacterium]MCA3096108.1 Flp pilus assembly complex ATPase component TadA [Rhodocyclaceae bacterium]MCA3096614.1 Flp pilus assembly complex ATPase component TadA [Rhodocyclaceae bacterium]